MRSDAEKASSTEGDRRQAASGRCADRPMEPRRDAVRAIGVNTLTYYRWRREFGDLKSDQVRKLKDLEAENTRLRKAVADLALDKLSLAESAKGNF